MLRPRKKYTVYDLQQLKGQRVLTHIHVKSPEEAAAHSYTDAEHHSIERLRARAIYGTPQVVGDKLRALAAQYGVEAIAILTTLLRRSDKNAAQASIIFRRFSNTSDRA